MKSHRTRSSNLYAISIAAFAATLAAQVAAQDKSVTTAPHTPPAATAALESKPRAPAILPGKGLAQYDFFYAGEAKAERMFIVRDGRIAWSYTHPAEGEISDAILLPNGHVLFAHQHGVTEITADKKVIWNYDAPANTEIHTAQHLDPDRVWFIQNGNPAKCIMVNIVSGVAERQFELPVGNPKGTHGQFRHARLTSAGTLLVAHMDLGKVVEYELTGQSRWSIAAPSAWSAVELANRNILVTGRSVREVDRQGQTVWEWKPSDTPEYEMRNLQLATRLPSGHTLINGWFNSWSDHLDPANLPVQAIEVTADLKVVWALRSWTEPANLGPSTTIQILDRPAR